jgi:hypothetical protein
MLMRDGLSYVRVCSSLPNVAQIIGRATLDKIRCAHSQLYHAAPKPKKRGELGYLEHRVGVIGGSWHRLIPGLRGITMVANYNPLCHFAPGLVPCR